MPDDFQLGDGSVRVREKDGRFQRVETPDGFTDEVFRNAIAAFDSAFRLNGKHPSVTEVHEFYPRIPVKTYSALFLTDEFKQALSYRGIEWEAEQGLSLQQNMALLALTDPTDRRTTAVKMRDLGIPMARYQAWMRHPLFQESYRTRSENNLKDAIPMVLNRLIGNAEASDQRAIEKILEMTGRWNPQQQQLEDAKTVVLNVVESVIRNVLDPDVRKAILADVQANVVSFELTHQQRSLEQ